MPLLRTAVRPSLLLTAGLLLLAPACGDGNGGSITDTAEDAATTSAGSAVGTRAGAGEVTRDDGAGDGSGGVGSSGAGAGSDSGQETPADRAAVTAMAESIEASVVVARLDDETAVIWHDGSMVDLPVSTNWGLWSDGDFVYRYAGEGTQTIHSSATTLDGTVVCEGDGPIDHITARPDGSYVMAVPGDDQLIEKWDGVGEYEVPLEAIDCLTGERQAIEPVLVFGTDGEVRFTERIGHRIFTGYGDAEGNADMVNERGTSINGQDYAGYHTFNDDGSVVAYGDMATAAGPHASTVVIARDSDSGEQLWRVEFDIPFRTMAFVDRRLAVTFVDDEVERMNFVDRIDRMVMLDAATGERLSEVAVGFDLVFVG